METDSQLLTIKMKKELSKYVFSYEHGRRSFFDSLIHEYDQLVKQ